MKETRAYRLSFKTPFHLDEHGTGFYQHSQRFIRSDTLTAAILSAWKMLDKNVNETFFQNPPFILSSTFPYLNVDGQTHYFLPRPECSRAVELDSSFLSFSKDIKKINWLALDIWQEVVNETWDWKNYCSHRLEIGALELKEREDKQIYQTIGDDALFRKKGELSGNYRLSYTEHNLRISSDRINQLNTGLFDFSRIYYHDNAGLYFLAQLEDENIKSSFEAALCLLGDMGIGADRNTGHGLFTFEPETIDVPEPKNRAIALSLVSPSQKDLENNCLENAAYDLIKRGGWVAGTNLRKKPIRMLTEGSSFNRPLIGEIKNVTPEVNDIKNILGYDAIYRYGRGFFVGGQNG